MPANVMFDCPEEIIATKNCEYVMLGSKFATRVGT